MKLIAFDVDGTLLNTLQSIQFHVNNTLEENGYNRIDDMSYIQKILGYGSQYLIQMSLSHPINNITDEKIIKDILEKYKKKYNSNPSYLTKPYDGVKKLLKDLKNEGYILIAYSNKPDSVLKQVLNDILGNDIFEYIEGQIDGKPHKPNGTVLSSIVEKYGLSKDEAIYVGDSDVDIQTAKNAGLKVIAVTYGFRDREFLQKLQPDFLVDTCEEVKEIIDNFRGINA